MFRRMKASDIIYPIGTQRFQNVIDDVTMSTSLLIYHKWHAFDKLPSIVFEKV